MTEKNIHSTALTSLEEVSEEELDYIIGGIGNGVIVTITHECHMNTLQHIFRCC